MIDVRELAFTIARNAFELKIDKAGQPYFNHLCRVAEQFKEDDLLYVVAILHDLLEDIPEWNIHSLRHVFTENVCSTIEVLTKNPKEDYFEYINRIKQSSWATKVKLSDLKDNMDITRLEKITDVDYQRLNKYLKAYQILTQS